MVAAPHLTQIVGPPDVPVCKTCKRGYFHVRQIGVTGLRGKVAPDLPQPALPRS